MDDYVPALVFFFFMFLVGGFGYLILNDSAQNERYRLACLEAGKSIVGSSCLKVAP